MDGFKDFRIENGSSEGQNLALTGVFVPSSLDRGKPDLDLDDVRLAIQSRVTVQVLGCRD